MDSSSTTYINHPLKQPMLVIGGLAGGIISGFMLSLTLAPDIDEPEKYSLPVHFNTAYYHHLDQDTASPMSASKHSDKYTKTIATLPATDTVDPALAYLEASKSLTYDSKTLLASINNTNLERPDWSWSRDDLSLTRVPAKNTSGTKQQQAHVFPNQHSNEPLPAQALLTQDNDAKDVKQDIAEKSPFHDSLVPEISAKERLVVVLDPGHGGTDPGAEAHNGLIEKELTLDMAQRVELFLSEVENVDVVMTRGSDVGMSRQNRVNKIKQVGADVVVSLHFNHLPQTDINLVETFYADRHNVIESLTKQRKPLSSVNLDHTNASKTLAHIMHNKVFNEVANANAPSAVIDAGVKSETLFVLTRSFTPGVLLELTCISNPPEAEKLASPEYRNQLAASIADGLRDYLMELHNEKFDELLVKLDL